MYVAEDAEGAATSLDHGAAAWLECVLNRDSRNSVCGTLGQACCTPDRREVTHPTGDRIPEVPEGRMMEGIYGVSVRDQHPSELRLIHNDRQAASIRVVVSGHADELASDRHVCDQVAHDRVRRFGMFSGFEESFKNVTVQHHAIAGGPSVLQETLGQVHVGRWAETAQVPVARHQRPHISPLPLMLLRYRICDWHAVNADFSIHLSDYWCATAVA